VGEQLFARTGGGNQFDAIQLSRDFDGLRAGDIHLATFEIRTARQHTYAHHPLLKY
jgi:hypothetical protein